MDKIRELYKQDCNKESLTNEYVDQLIKEIKNVDNLGIDLEENKNLENKKDIIIDFWRKYVNVMRTGKVLKKIIFTVIIILIAIITVVGKKYILDKRFLK